MSLVLLHERGRQQVLFGVWARPRGTRSGVIGVSPSADTLVQDIDGTDGQEGSRVVLQATGLRREYGPVIAVDGVDLSMAEGEFLTIFGPNGAGKTSLLGMLGGSMRPTRVL